MFKSRAMRTERFDTSISIHTISRKTITYLGIQLCMGFSGFQNCFNMNSPVANTLLLCTSTTHPQWVHVFVFPNFVRNLDLSGDDAPLIKHLTLKNHMIEVLW